MRSLLGAAVVVLATLAACSNTDIVINATNNNDKEYWVDPGPKCCTVIGGRIAPHGQGTITVQGVPGDGLIMQEHAGNFITTAYWGAGSHWNIVIDSAGMCSRTELD